MSDINNLYNLKKKLKKLVAIVAVFCLVAISSQVKTYPHIPLKGLFEVLKVDDIGFSHALLHSKWIENMYQYGAGKPHRKVKIKKGKDTSWRAEYESDAVANLVRKFWFRKSENHQLLPTKFGFLANIRNDQLGTFFGELINYIYTLRQAQGERWEEEGLINELFAYDPKAAKFNSELAELERDLDIVNAQLVDKRFAGLQEATKIFRQKKKELKRKWKDAELVQKLKEVERNAFLKISKEVLDARDQYKKFAREAQDLENKINAKVKQKRKIVQKALFDPIRKALQLCRVGDIYVSRTTEGILWALFFHKLDDLISLEEKIKAINNCLGCIDKEFKREGFKNNGVLKDLYDAKGFELFGQQVRDLEADKQVVELMENYDQVLHCLINQVAGENFPPIISQGNYGYEYEPGNISYPRPDCHETAVLDVFSILWYNLKKGTFDDSLFSDDVIKNGQGLQRLREALKYFYLADSKGISAREYTVQGKFTSLTKLKELEKITLEEIEALDISEIPVSYITRPEIKQEFFNIVSGIPGVIYRSEVPGKGAIFEIGSDVRNVITIFNYFYGTRAKNIIELGDGDIGISTDSRTIVLKKESDENAPNKIKITVSDYENNVYFKVKINIRHGHTFITVDGREKIGSEGLDPYLAENILEKIVGKTGKDNACIQVNQNREKLLSAFSLLAFQKLLKNDEVAWDLPSLNLVYYTLMMKTPEVKLKVIKNVLERHPQNYERCKGVIHNFIEELPRDDQHLKAKLTKIIIRSGFYEKEPYFKNFIKEEVLKDPQMYDSRQVVEILLEAFKKKYSEIAATIVHNPQFNEDADTMGRLLILALQNEVDKDIALAIVNNSRFKADFRCVGHALVLALNKKYIEIALAIVNNSAFDASLGKWRCVSMSGSSCYNCFMGKALFFALNQGHARIAQKIMDHPKFTYWGGALIFALEHECTEIAMTILKNKKFDVNCRLIQRIDYAEEFLEREPRRRQDLQKIIDAINKKKYMKKNKK